MANVIGLTVMLVFATLTVAEIYSEPAPAGRPLRGRSLYRRHQSGITWKSAHDVKKGGTKSTKVTKAREKIEREKAELKKKIKKLQGVQARIRDKIKRLLEHLRDDERLLQRWHHMFV